MKKLFLLVLVFILSVTVSGCLKNAPLSESVTSASLIKVKEKRDTFSLAKARRQNKAALDYADAADDPLGDDSFLTYVEAAKIAAEAEQPLSLAAQELSVGAGEPQSGTPVSQAANESLYSGLTAADVSGSSSYVADSSSGGTNGASQGGADGASQGGAESQGTDAGGTDTSTTVSQPAPVDPDYQELMTYFDQFNTYQSVADQAVSQVSGDAWGSRDLLIDDADLVNLFSTAHEIFDFIHNHPGVEDGDNVLATVGDTLTSVHTIWGVGRYEAQTAYLMIGIYYPGGDYVAHAETQLLLL